MQEGFSKKQLSPNTTTFFQKVTFRSDTILKVSFWFACTYHKVCEQKIYKVISIIQTVTYMVPYGYDLSDTDAIMLLGGLLFT